MSERTDHVNKMMADILAILKGNDSVDQIMALAGALSHVEDERRLAMMVDAYRLFNKLTADDILTEVAMAIGRAGGLEP